MPVTEASVVIAISSTHRKEALEAVHETIDALKAKVPIWKKVFQDILYFLSLSSRYLFFCKVID